MGQGSGGAALASGLDIARGVQSYFAGSQDKVSYGRVRSQPQSYQDDILRVAPHVSSARAGNVKLTAMMRERQLTSHPTKTCYLVYGSKQYKEQVQKELDQEPLMFGDFQVRPKESDVYLGDTLAAAGGLEAGAEATVAKRVARAQGAMFEAKSLVQDYRLQAIGGMEGAWDIWNSGICPSVLANCGSWVKISKTALGQLEDCQNQYLRMVCTCPPSTSLPALRSQGSRKYFLDAILNF